MIELKLDVLTARTEGSSSSFSAGYYPDVQDDLRISLDMDQLLPTPISAESLAVSQNSITVIEDQYLSQIHEELEMMVYLVD